MHLRFTGGLTCAKTLIWGRGDIAFHSQYVYTGSRIRYMTTYDDPFSLFFLECDFDKALMNILYCTTVCIIFNFYTFLTCCDKTNMMWWWHGWCVWIYYPTNQIVVQREAHKPTISPIYQSCDACTVYKTVESCHLALKY